jgi:glucan phosphoethanolaminetransferase (alkaline phosphatase superfamily)
VDIVMVFLFLVLVIAAFGATRFGWIAAATAAGVTALLVGLITWTVFGEDGYVQNGSSRWDTSGAGPHDVYIVAMVVAALLFTVYLALALRRSRGPIVSVAVVAGGLLEAFGVLAVALAFASD